MPTIVRAALIQQQLTHDARAPLQEIREAMIAKAIGFIEDAARRGARIICLQELFYGPYFPAEQDPSWYALAERMPDGPTMQLMMETARRLGVVLIVPIYEVENTGVYYNTAGLIDADGRFLGRYRKSHLPHCLPGFWEKFYFRPGNLGYPVFETAVGKVGIFLCYDRHFPEGARALGLHGAEMVFNPSATVAGLSEYLWRLEQPAHAVASQFFICAINRVGREMPWNIGEFYGQSYFCNPRGQIFAEAARDREEVLVADMDLDLIREVRDVWQFYRDRRPESYGDLTAP